MYTYHHVIRRLTEADKIRLLTDLYSLSDPETEGLGIPQVNCAALREGLRGDDSAELPSPAALARSWDTELMTEAAAEAARRLGDRGIHHVILPPAGSAIVSDGERLSEDPCLSGSLAASLLAGVRRGGLTATAAGWGFTPADAAAMDTPPTRRFTVDHMVSPYATLTKDGFLLGIIAENGEPVSDSMARAGYYILRRRASERETVTALAQGELLIRGSASALEAALHTYRHIKTAITHGKATMGELETAVREGEAMSEETLNAALDRLLSFAAACRDGASLTDRRKAAEPVEAATLTDDLPTDGQITHEMTADSPTEPPNSRESVEVSPAEPPNTPESPEDAPATPAEDTPIHPPFDTATHERPAASSAALTQRALDGATVLLENRDQLLPLQKPARLCILGDLARQDGDVLPLIEAIQRHGHTYAGFARGYDPAIPRNHDLTAEAVALAAEADVILTFVGTEKGKSRLPAAQLALVHEVGRMLVGRKDKRMVVILSSEISPDMGFVRTSVVPLAGLLLTPMSVKGAALHAVETVLGDRAPLGRLTETLIDPADPAADRKGYKVGPFVGYRYYDTVGCGALYPFGHGLSYTKFRYSCLKINPQGILTFTVRNVGKQSGVALPQVYAGIKSSAILRPKKELVSFARIPLAPGQQATVTLPWRLPPADGGAGLTEKGIYRISVGESVEAVRLTAEIPAGLHTVESDGAHPHEYLPTATNIHTERYVMEAEYTPMKPSLRNLLFGIAALVLAVSVKIYDVVSVSNAVFLNIVAGLLAVGSVFFFVLEFLDRKKQFARERVELEEANATLFSEAADIPVPSADALFDLAAQLPDGEETEESTPESRETYDHFLDADRTLTFPKAMAAFTALAAERGLTPVGSTSAAIFAAMASSRLLITRGMSADRFAALVSLLGAYFGCPVSVDTVDESYTDETALLYTVGEEGETMPRNALDAIEAARREPRTIQLLALDGVDPDGISDYLVPYVRYARAPHSACTVKTHDAEGAETACLLPENLWLILNLREGAVLPSLPDYVTEVASVVTPLFESVEPAATHAELPPFRYGQMLYLCDRLKADFSLEEDTWKRIDRIEAYGARLGGFSVSNKLWLGLESYLAVLLTVEPDAHTALDEALAARLLPALLTVLSGKIPKEERGLAETLDAILGDDHTPICRKTIKESGADLT